MVLFKVSMDTEPDILSKLSGMFSNRTERYPLPMFDAANENCVKAKFTNYGHSLKAGTSARVKISSSSSIFFCFC